MKALILAAGRGTRLHKYVKDLPKGMLVFGNMSIIQRQIENFRSCGINDIIVVKGYMADTITYEGIKYFCNKDFATTNMVESLFCAESEFNEDLIVSYADVLYEKCVLQGLMKDKSPVAVTVDMDWKKYWQIRYGRIDNDIESLKLNKDDSIAELGNEKVKIEDIDARYVGLLKFSKETILQCIDFYHTSKDKFSGKPWKGGRIFEQAYMTDFIQSLIDEDIKVNSYKINSGWIEFDTNEDYELLSGMLKNNSLDQLIRLG